MSFPDIQYLPIGSEKVAQSTAIGNLPLGQRMVLPDGREFSHTKAGGTALVSGVLVSSSAGVAGHGAVSASGLLASATTTYNQIGDTVVHIATGGTVATVDQYADGILNVQKSAGIGYVYRIKSNKSAASASDLEITLDPKDPLKVAWAAGSTAVSLRKSNFRDAIVMTGSAPVAPPIGVTPVAVSANFYFWAQRKGDASVRTAGTTVTDGQGVIASTVTAGSVTVVGASSANAQLNAVIGYARETVSAGDACLVDLCLS